jgi:hypothetical protein
MAATHLAAAHASFELVIAELIHPDPKLSATRKRLRQIATAMGENNRRLREVLERHGLVDGESGPLANDVLAREELRLIELEELVFRDWGWGDEGDGENRILYELVASLCEQRPLGKLAVLGAGACRLPYDLHQHHAPELTLALDLNPLPFVLAHEVMFNGELSLFELPVSPHDAERLCIERKLCAPKGTPHGLHLVFGDALRPPFAPAKLDTIVTTWFLDQVGADARDVMTTVHELLAEGGRWINVGPVMYPRTLARTQRYLPDELVELVEHTGFQVTASRPAHVPYLFAPGSSSGRMVHVFAFSAEKTGAARPIVEPAPAWARSFSEPVPMRTDLERAAPPHRIIQAVAAAVDGKASIAQIAHRVMRESGLPEDAQRRAVRAVLLELFRATEKGA